MNPQNVSAPAVSSSDRLPTGPDALYRSVFESLTEFAVFVIAADGSVKSWNTGAEQTFGYSADEIIGQNFSMIFTPEDVAAGAPAQELRTSLSGEQPDHDRWHVRKDGTRFWGTNTVEPIFDRARKLLGFTKLVRDITDMHLASEAVSDSEQRLRLLIESVHDFAIFSVALDGTVLSWNVGAEAMFGYDEAAIVGQPLAVLHTTGDVNAGVLRRDLRETAQSGSVADERWLVRKDGSRFLASAKMSPLKRGPDGQLRGFAIIAHDITEQKRLSDDLQTRARSDQLTKLLNRATFYEHVTRAIASLQRRPGHTFAVMFIDLDHFKAVNDIYGHVVADRLLESTARRLEKCVRSRDIIARLGGDEFAILLNGINGVSDASDAGDRIGKVMSETVEVDGYSMRVTASVGIAMGSVDYGLPEHILADADAAMYVAKTNGRARSVLFDPGMRLVDRQNLDLEIELRHALERGELRVDYQPILKLPGRSIVGFEALVRWQHPRRGLLQPNEFMPRAEAGDAIVPIDRWVFGVACRQLKAWQDCGIASDSLQISVNFSSKQFSRVDLIADLCKTIEETKISAQGLCLEMTETGIIERSADTVELLNAIRDLGISLHIDDFGMGYASLEAVVHMPIQALKIDRSFIAAMDTPNGARVVRSLVALGHNLDLQVIAEGVEMHEQLTAIEGFACDFAQGFLISKPLDPRAAEDFLRAAARPVL